MRFCSKCGCKLINKTNEAQKELYMTPIGPMNFDRYDTETGKQQYVEWLECPNHHWWNGHDTLWPKLVKVSVE